MENRKELEAALEGIFMDIMDDVASKHGRLFDGDLEDSLERLAEAKTILQQLNKDRYEDAEDYDDTAGGSDIKDFDDDDDDDY